MLVLKSRRAMLDTLVKHLNMLRLSAGAALVLALVGCTGLIDGGGGGSLTPEQRLAQEKWVDKALPVLRANCMSCHGANFSKPIDPSYPKIAGQHADYLFVALKEYKAENNPAVGRNNPIMGAMAKQFSNADLKALANYVGSLDGELKTVPESRFHQH